MQQKQKKKKSEELISSFFCLSLLVFGNSGFLCFEKARSPMNDSIDIFITGLNELQ